MKNRLFLVFAMVMMAILASGCGKMPQESIRAAKSAVDAAKNAQADIYMASEYKALEDSLNVMMQKIEAENSKFMKDFGEVKTQLEALTVQAEKVTAAVPAKKEAVKTEAETMVTTIKDNLAATRTLLAKAPLGKEGRAAITQITGELNVIETRVKEVEAALREDINYAEALDRLNAAQKSVTDINTELTEAIAKKKGR